ncbi:hypothetical protein FBY35_0066 [Streptomyces sp. SLBN-118]|uniref:hypothetical protein n=1 Tax=Streptomyces sp. SLBN-118 TaxID=2768454 RepID=UPI0011514DD0|nr:hypothetical protein [Streptomyces sp. SLBN-118]TQK49798.1 hypothetical protein FBY35_0066 [Streptomyces sp. SLBN-118]
MAGALAEVNEAVEQVLKASARGSIQQHWFHELVGYWRQVDAAVRPYLKDVGLTPTQPVRVTNALEELASMEPQPFMRITGDPGSRHSIYRQAGATIGGAKALMALLDELPALERIEG